ARLEALLQEAEAADDTGLAALDERLRAEGLYRERQAPRDAPGSPEREFPPGVRIRRYHLEGWEVLWGENATSNDYLPPPVAPPRPAAPAPGRPAAAPPRPPPAPSGTPPPPPPPPTPPPATPPSCPWTTPSAATFANPADRRLAWSRTRTRKRFTSRHQMPMRGPGWSKPGPTYCCQLRTSAANVPKPPGKSSASRARSTARRFACATAISRWVSTGRRAEP